MRRHYLHPPEPPPPSPPRAARPHRRLDHPSPADRAGARERVLPEERADHARPGTCPRGDPARRAAGGARDRTLRPRHSEEDGGRRGGRAQGPGRRSGGATPQAEAGPDAGRRGGRRGGRAHAHSPRVIAQVSGRLAAKLADRVVVQTAGGIGKKTAERLALELADKLREFEGPGAGGAAAAPGDGTAEAALKALERLGYGTAEADRALRDVLAADGGGSTETLVRRALHLLTGG